MDVCKQLPTMNQEDVDLAVNGVTSFYQSKRALLKKQVTHWMGKFAIVKHENNILRNKVKVRDASIMELMGALEGKSYDYNSLAGATNKTISEMARQIQELEAGALT